MVRVRKKRPRVVVVQQRNRLDALPAVYPTQFGGRDSLSGLPPPVLHPAVVQPGLSSTAFQPRTAYLPAAGPAAVYQNSGYRPRLGNSGRRSGVPLPKCSYINTDFPGDDLYLDGATSAGLNAGSARACKARCKLEELCNFWTYREGDNRDTLTRDCFLKEGTPGEGSPPVPKQMNYFTATADGLRVLTSLPPNFANPCFRLIYAFFVISLWSSIAFICKKICNISVCYGKDPSLPIEATSKNHLFLEGDAILGVTS